MQAPQIRLERVPTHIAALSAPKGPQLAAFDADGVLWQGDVFEELTQWLMRRNEIEDRGWADYMEAAASDPIAGAYRILEFYRGMSLEALKMHVSRFWAAVPRHWNADVLASMQWLREQGHTVYVVSATPFAILQPLKRLLPVDCVLGMELEVDPDGRFTGRHTGTATVGEGKARRIEERWKHPVRVALGNSMLDAAMLSLAQELAWAYAPDPDLRAEAVQRGWLVTEPDDR